MKIINILFIPTFINPIELLLLLLFSMTSDSFPYVLHCMLICPFIDSFLILALYPLYY